MIDENVTAYLDDLMAALRGVEASDSAGTRLLLGEATSRAVAIVMDVRGTGGKAMLAGNGGSAAIGSHVHNDLCRTVGVRALVFNEAPLLTSLSNDCGYTSAFETPVRLWANPGDLLIAISSSGKSESILRAVRAAAERECRIITFSGFDPRNALRATGDVNFYVPSRVYGHVELAHHSLTHFITDCAGTMVSRAATFAAQP